MPVLFPLRHDQAEAAASATYGGEARSFHSRLWLCLCGVFAVVVCAVSPAEARTLNIVAFGDSLTAGYMLPAANAFPAVLEQALRKDGLDVTVANAGVSGDTTADGVERLDWSVPDGTDGVILELGANDMLRGLDPAITRKNLDGMITTLQKRHIAVFLAGIYANPTLGADFGKTFNAIYADLAKTYGIPLYPFFLAGVVGQPKLQLQDGMHPNAEGVAAMVRGILPNVEQWLKTLPPA